MPKVDASDVVVTKEIPDEGDIIIVYPDPSMAFDILQGIPVIVTKVKENPGTDANGAPIHTITFKAHPTKKNELSLRWMGSKHVNTLQKYTTESQSDASKDAAVEVEGEGEAPGEGEGEGEGEGKDEGEGEAHGEGNDEDEGEGEGATVVMNHEHPIGTGVRSTSRVFALPSSSSSRRRYSSLPLSPTP